MTLSGILTIITCISIFSLGLLVFLRDPKNKVNKLYAWMIFWLLVWIISNFLENEPYISEKAAVFFLRLDFATAPILGYFVLLFCLNVPRPLFVSRFMTFLVSIPILLFVILSWFNVIITNFQHTEGIYYDKGLLYPYYAFFVFSYIIGGCVSLLWKYRKLQGIEKSRILYILLGFTISGLIALVVNLFFQQPGVSPAILRIGIYGLLFLVSFTAYAIVKKQLFDIRVIAAETLVALITLGLLIDSLLSKSFFEGGLKAILFVLACYGGYRLVLSVHEEIKRRQEIANLASQLKIANEHLKELDLMKTEFVSLASHELLTPVSAIEGYLSMVLDEKIVPVKEPKLQKYLSSVYSAAQRLAKLVTDMLNVSRIEEGRLLVEKKEINLSELIQHVIDELKFKAEERQQKILFDKSEALNPKSEITAEGGIPLRGTNPNVQNNKPASPAGGFETYGDPDKLKEVLINLIGNSIKYSKKPGTITVSIEQVPTPNVQQTWQKIENEIKARPLDDQEAIKSTVDERLKRLVGEHQILIHIKDQGIGIPKEELPRLFKKFHRVGDYTIAESQGTGLGLYISRALVELHHGRIWAESEGPSHGSTFTFSLPEISAKGEIEQLEAQVPKKAELKPLAKPTKEAEEL